MYLNIAFKQGWITLMVSNQRHSWIPVTSDELKYPGPFPVPLLMLTLGFSENRGITSVNILAIRVTSSVRMLSIELFRVLTICIVIKLKHFICIEIMFIKLVD